MAVISLSSIPITACIVLRYSSPMGEKTRSFAASHLSLPIQTKGRSFLDSLLGFWRMVSASSWTCFFSANTTRTLARRWSRSERSIRLASSTVPSVAVNAGQRLVSIMLWRKAASIAVFDTSFPATTAKWVQPKWRRRSRIANALKAIIATGTKEVRIVWKALSVRNPTRDFVSQTPGGNLNKLVCRSKGCRHCYLVILVSRTNHGQHAIMLRHWL